MGNQKIEIKMKYQALVALLGAASAQMTPGMNLYAQFGVCQSRSGKSAYGSYNACKVYGDDVQCCEFKQTEVDDDGLICVTDAERDGELDGIYSDNQDTLWEWTCKYDAKPADEPSGDGPGGRGGRGRRNGEPLPAW